MDRRVFLTGILAAGVAPYVVGVIAAPVSGGTALFSTVSGISVKDQISTSGKTFSWISIKRQILPSGEMVLNISKDCTITARRIG